MANQGVHFPLPEIQLLITRTQVNSPPYTSGEFYDKWMVYSPFLAEKNPPQRLRRATSWKILRKPHPGTLPGH